jgi:hypothetical protein
MHSCHSTSTVVGAGERRAYIRDVAQPNVQPGSLENAPDHDGYILITRIDMQEPSASTRS